MSLRTPRHNGLVTIAQPSHFFIFVITQAYTFHDRILSIALSFTVGHHFIRISRHRINMFNMTKEIKVRIKVIRKKKLKKKKIENF